MFHKSRKERSSRSKASPEMNIHLLHRKKGYEYESENYGTFPQT